MKKLTAVLMGILFVSIPVFAQINYALSFDGVDDYVDLTNSANVSNDIITIECWLYWRGGDNLGYVFSNYDGGGFEQGDIHLNFCESPLVLRICEYNSGNPGMFYATIVPNTWNHIAVVYDGSNRKIFKNGNLEHTFPVTGSVMNCSRMIRVGHSLEPWPYAHLDGIVDEVRISHCARYTENFTPQLYLPTDAQTVGHWHFDEGTGNIVYDSSVNGYNGSIFDATWVESQSYLTISLTPANPPIVIPETGGTFDFDIGVTNNTPDPQTIDIWTEVILTEVGSFQDILFLDFLLPGGAAPSRERSLEVPAIAPAGEYQYCAYVGEYPWIVWDDDSFIFTKEGTDSDWLTALPYWNGYGESFDEKSILPIESPSAHLLHSAHPNPFNPTTALSYQLQAASYVELVVYDIQGREAARLVDGLQSAGIYEFTFNASELASGVYFARMTAGSFQQTQKLLLIK